MIIYIVYSYDNMPYSDQQDYAVRGFFLESEAEAYCFALNKKELEGLAMDEAPWTLHEVRELEVEE